MATCAPIVIRIGHRGALGHAPENTRASFEAGLRLGADAVECDVHLTKDRQLVVIHDGTLERTTNGRGPVAGKTWVQLKSLDAGSRFAPSYSGERLWRLRDLLAWAKPRRTRTGRPLQVVVEIKSRPGVSTEMSQRVVGAIRKAGMVRRAFVISFDHAAAASVKKLCPSLRTGLLFSAIPRDWVRRMESTKADSLFPRYTLVTEKLVELAHRNKWFVGTWTVDAPADIQRLVRWGVDAIASNFPERVGGNVNFPV